MLGVNKGNYRLEDEVKTLARARLFGSDVSFCHWMRQCADLPAWEPLCGFVATDTDLVIHRYLTAIDSNGSREIQTLMHVEIKTRLGRPSDSQLDTLYKHHRCSMTKRNLDVNGESIRHHGVSILRMDGLTPDDSTKMLWHRFHSTKRALLAGREIDKATLIKLFRFELHPDTFDPQPYRRHHLTRCVVRLVRLPLGFEVEEEVVLRS